MCHGEIRAYFQGEFDRLWDGFNERASFLDNTDASQQSFEARNRRGDVLKKELGAAWEETKQAWRVPGLADLHKELPGEIEAKNRDIAATEQRIGETPERWWSGSAARRGHFQCRHPPTSTIEQSQTLPKQEKIQ